MALVTISDISIHYELVGDARLPMLVLSHSLGVDLSMWEPQLSDLAAHFRVLRYDTRGHGKSSIPPGPYVAAGLGRDVLLLMDALKVEKASFCGLSMGGIIGQWLGVNAPERLDKLILCNTAAKIGNAEGWNARIAVVLRDGLTPIIPGTLERWFTPSMRTAEPALVARVEAMLERMSASGYVACCEAIRDADFRDQLDAISAPTLVIAGTEDPVTSTADGRFMADRIRGARYAELKTAHLSNLGAAKAFNAEVVAFLNE